ncbi:MAG: transglutaminase family protein [Acidobacteria bacterium]|jgi:hypothetical protein|nr:transglutaminase family protein [Acidobacteriota bacterium]
MLTPWEIARKGMLPPPRLLGMFCKGAVAVLAVVLKNFKLIRGVKRRQAGPPFARPPRQYALPGFRAGMSNLSRERKYLRPTLYCDCRAPEVTVMALQLGAGIKSDREFAEAAFEFTKRNIAIEIMAMDDVGRTLARGAGNCFHKTAVFVALCRAAGVPARFKYCSLTDMEAWFGSSLQNSPLIRQWYKAMGNLLPHGEGEVFIAGSWVAADISRSPWWQAAKSLPISRLGESAIGLWMTPVPGSIFVRESLPLGFGWPSRLLSRFFAGAVAGYNRGLQEQDEIGLRVIAAAGGEAAYDAEARRRRLLSAARADLLREHERIVFDEK